MASANSSLIFFSATPTYLSNISPALTILGGLAFKAYDSFLAIRVLPVPGGPYKRIPLV